MAYTVTKHSFNEIRDTWKALLPRAAVNSVFLTPRWHRLWWDAFGADQEAVYLQIDQDASPVAVAPLQLAQDTLSLAGSTEVCDYLDVILLEEHCTSALSVLLEHISKLSWSTLVLHSISSESPTLAFLRQLSVDPENPFSVNIEQEDVCPRVDLPGDWESYLGMLSKKDRHELRRKFRRLESAGGVEYKITASADGLQQELEHFFRLMRTSREDKAAFMTPEKESFFRNVAETFVGAGIGKIFSLTVDGVHAAAILCFDYNNQRLLYNSGFDHRFSSLSVGLLLKAYALRDAIEHGMSRYDFLRGNEPYKYDLGGVDSPIYQCTIQRR